MQWASIMLNGTGYVAAGVFNGGLIYGDYYLLKVRNQDTTMHAYQRAPESRPHAAQQSDFVR